MEKQRKFVGLSDAERSEIAILSQRGCSMREIAKALGRSPNTVSYELRKNSTAGVYDPLKAKQKSRVARRSRRYRWRKIEQHPALRAFVIAMLKAHWSPDAIAGYLRHQQTELPTVGKDQLYAWLYSSRGQPYCEHLLSKRYNPKKRPENKADRAMIPNKVSITERPAVVDSRTRAGDWEGDTVVSGKRTGGKAALAVCQERQTRLITATLIPNLRPESFTTAAVTMLTDKQALTLSLDNGIENKQHEDIGSATGAAIFFCDPYSSWQKGGVEHANKMLRRYLPKGCDLGRFDQAFVDAACDRLNKKPRKILGYKSALQLAVEKGVI